MTAKLGFFALAVLVGFVVMSAYGNRTESAPSRPVVVENTVPGDSSICVEGTTPEGHRFSYCGSQEQADALTEIADAVVIER